MNDESDKPLEVLAEGKFLRLLKRGRWEYVERPNARGAAFVVAVTDEGELVLVEQYRVPLGQQSIELPAGIIGDEAQFTNESALESGLRELEEETGFRAARAELLFVGPTAPGLSSEHISFIRAFELRRVGPGGGVADEDIQVHVVPLERIDEWLAMKREAGYCIEPRIYAGLYFAKAMYRS